MVIKLKRTSFAANVNLHEIATTARSWSARPPVDNTHRRKNFE